MRRLDECLSVDQVRQLAQRSLPLPIFDALSGGVGDGCTFRRNVSDFEDIALTPRVLRDVETYDTSVTVLGQRLNFPLILSPTGFQGILWPDGEVAAARAAAMAGIMYGLSCFANSTIEEVASAGPGPRMLQIYGLTDDYITSDLLERAEAAGYQAICVTVDTPVMSPMENLDRWQLIPGRRPPAKTMLQLLRRPDWLWRQRTLGAKQLPPVVRQFLERGHELGSEGLSKLIRKDFTWNDMAALRKRWKGAFAVKGILNARDARQAVDAGATAVIVCNHGGLSVDGAASSISVLPEISDSVGKDIEVLVGSGVRRGASIAKAMALGANAALSGRGFLYGLGAAGEPGVAKVISILQREFTAAMRLSGCASPQQFARDLIRFQQGQPLERG